MVASTTSSSRRVVYAGLLAVILLCAVVRPDTGAGTIVEPEPTGVIADLERLTQQIEDPQQRAELLKTLRALVTAAKQTPAAGQAPATPAPSPELPQGLFFAFGELTQHIAVAGRQAVQSVATLPALVADLLKGLQDPEMHWFFLYVALSAAILIAAGILLQLVAGRVQKRYRTRVLARVPLSSGRKLWLSLITLGLAIAPYVVLLALSGTVFSFLPLGPVISGLAALFITSVLVYRVLCSAATVLSDPERPEARLLPIRDSTAQYTWRWAQRLSLLAALYLLVTRTLLTMGVAHEVFLAGRGLLLLVWAVVLSVLVLQLARRQPVAREDAATTHQRRWGRVTATLHVVWPIIALAYIWCATLLALFSTQYSPAFLVAASLQTAVVIVGGLALLGAGEYLLTKIAGLTTVVGRYMPGLQFRTLRYLRIVWWGVRVILIVAASLLILDIWGLGLAWLLTSPLGINLLARLLTLLITAAAVLVVIDLSTFISEQLIQPGQDGVEASKKRKTLVPLTATVIKSVVLFIGGLIALYLVGINITPILAGVGIFSLAIGFGAQTLVKDIINGLFILVEDSIAVGDVVNIRGTGGLVEAVNLRTIRLRDLQGSVHIIPNSQVEIITNMTKDYSYYVLDVTVARREDIDEVIAALREIDSDMRADPAFAADMLAPIDILGLERFTESAVLVRARLKTKPIKQWSVGREFNRRMKKLFDARGIEIPFPARTIYWGQPKSGEAPALALQIRDCDGLTSTPPQEEPASVAPPDGGATPH